MKLGFDKSSIFNPKSKNSKSNLVFFRTLSSLSLTLKARAKTRKKRRNEKSPPKQKPQENLNAAGHQVARSCHMARPDRATWHGRATRHGQTVPYCWPASRARCVGARPCALTPVRSFACLCVSPCFWCPELHRTSTLLLNPPKMLSLLIKPEGSP